MIRTLSMIVLAASLSVSSLAVACESAIHHVKTVALSAEGIVTRSVAVRKDADGQNKSKSEPVYVNVVKDQIDMVLGDEIVLNAAPTTVDATFMVKIRMEEQERDAQGVMSTTYHVVEESAGTFAGPSAPIKNAYRLKLQGTYLGNGSYAKGCGKITKTRLDLESSEDVRDHE